MTDKLRLMPLLPLYFYAAERLRERMLTRLVSWVLYVRSTTARSW